VVLLSLSLAFSPVLMLIFWNASGVDKFWKILMLALSIFICSPVPVLASRRDEEVVIDSLFYGLCAFPAQLILLAVFFVKLKRSVKNPSKRH